MYTRNLKALVFILLSSLSVACRMDRQNFNYSMKCVPIPSEEEYKLELLDSIHKLDTRMRWRAFHFLNPSQTKNSKETFGFNTSTAPPFIKELKTFQDGMIGIAKNLKFKKVTNQFQNQLRDDLKNIKREDRIIVAADKTRNHYMMDKEKYEDFLNNNITKDYKKADQNVVDDITKNDKVVASKLEIEDRVYCTTKRASFITLKDHKQNFENNPKFRVINPTKSELGRVSKQMLSEIISAVKSKAQLLQFKNTDATIDWFCKLKDKDRLHFIQFDVENFYASITPGLLENAITFAASHTTISQECKQTILQAANSFLYSDSSAWIKKKGDTFDITMGGFHGADICDVVGLYLLSQLVQVLPKGWIGLYRDDRLAVSSASRRQNNIMKKEICRIFEQHGLSITIQANC